MHVYCTRPTCPQPLNSIADLETAIVPGQIFQRYCIACRMPLVLSGKYIPIEQLGAGAFGVTFVAIDLNIRGRRCIVKQLRPTTILKPDQISKIKTLFEREAQSLDLLSEIPKIPTLFDYFIVKDTDPHSNTEQELYYLVQQYIDGEDLAAPIGRGERYSSAQIVTFLYQILPILEAVHDRGAIHRDVKPANMMRSSNGDIYLIDFGAVKQVMNGLPTQQSIVIGTDGYASPEQMMGGAVSPASDLYSLGASCMTLMSGKNPKDEGFREMLNDWQGSVQIDPRLAAILMRMTSSQARERYQTAGEVLSDLEQSQLLPENLPRTGVRNSPSRPLAPTIGSSQPWSVPPQPSPQPQSPTPIPALTLWQPLRHSAIFGSGSWLIAVAIFSFLGTAWYFSGLWLALLGALVLFAYSGGKFDKLQLLAIALVSNIAIFLIFSPAKIGGMMTSGIKGVAILLLLTILVAAISFALLTLSKLLTQSSSDR
jgi:serine/threonine protein kinase